MVTGFETVGVALAMLPLLVNQLDNYARGAEKVRAWRRPRRHLRKYALGIGTQRIIFLNNLEELLDGLIDDEDTIRELIDNPQGGLWQGARLQISLKARLGRSHDVFMENMVSLNDGLIRLSEKLGVDLSNGFNAAVSSDPKPSRWKVLSVAVYDDLLGSIGKANDTLRTLIEQSAYHKSSNRRPAWTHLLRRFREARLHAEGLFRAVARSDQWGCNCKDNHRVHLKIPPAPLKPEECDSLGHDCRLHVSFSNTDAGGQQRHWSWREVEFTPWKVDDPLPTGTLCSTQNRTTVQTAAPRRVRFKLLSQASTTQLPSGIPTRIAPGAIADMCSSLLSYQSPLEGRILGLVGAGLRSQYLMTSIEGHELNICGNPLKEHLQRASRRDRLRLATGLACGVVQFHGNWLKRNWDISDVHLGLRKDQANLSLDSLYCTWAVTAQPEATPGGKGKSSAPQIRSEILFPLGLALIQLSLGKPISDFHTPCTATTDDLQARLNEVYNESGCGYGDVVHSCLFCPQGITSLGFEDAKFEEHVLSTVVSPLLRELLLFEGQR